MIRLISVFFIATMAFVRTSTADQFDEIKKRLADAECYSVTFLSVLSSTVFDTKDSSEGFARIARDGRYHIALGDDIYSSDGVSSCAYSQRTNQLIVEKIGDGHVAHKQISFLSRLDAYYKTYPTKQKDRFRLVRKRGADATNIPDSMTVTIDSKRKKISQLVYLDINDEPVSIELLSQQLNLECADSLFIPVFPDSVETIKL